MPWRQITLPWLPIILLLVIVGVYLLVYNVLTICVAASSPCVAESSLESALNGILANLSAADTGSRFLALGGRLKWVTAVGFSILFTILAVSIAALAIHSTARLHVTAAATPLVATSLVLFSTMVFLALRATWGRPEHPWRQMLNKKLLDEVPQVSEWSPRLDSIGLLAALYLAFAATVVTRVALVQTRYSDRHEACAFWLRAILYIGAALLMATVLRSHALFGWSLAYLPESSATLGPDLVHVRTAAGVLGDTITAVEGAFFSAMLAALYLPSAFLLHTSGSQLLDASGKVTESGRKLWETQVPLTKVVPRILAILSPLATGWLASALEALQR